MSKHVRLSDDTELFTKYIRNLHEEIHCCITSSNTSYKQATDLHYHFLTFEEGDFVLVRTMLERFPLISVTSCHAHSIGLFPILKQVGENSYDVGIPSSWGISSTFNVLDLISYKALPNIDKLLLPMALPHLLPPFPLLINMNTLRKYGMRLSPSSRVLWSASFLFIDKDKPHEILMDHISRLGKPMT